MELEKKCQVSKERVLLENRMYLIYRYLTCEYLYLEPCLTFMDMDIKIEMSGNLGDYIKIEQHYGSGNIVVLASGDSRCHGGISEYTEVIVKDIEKEIRRIETN